MKKCIYFSRFLPSCDRGGGSHRLLQILDILKGLDYELVSTARKDRLSIEALNKIEATIKTSFSQPQSIDDEYHLWDEKRRTAVYRLREMSREWVRSIKGISQLELAILDDPIYFVPLLEQLRQWGIPVAAACQNLETLAPAQVGKDPARILFNKEVNLLAQCRLVISISREESFLLHNLGINTVFFPYFPVESILNRLLRVREKRRKTGKKGLLLLGNVLNLQNRQGMKKVISFWCSSGLFRKQGKLVVAGYGTEQHLGNDTDSDAVEFLGTLSNDMLDSLLCTVRACLCYQENGAGALTRISEMLAAGVPVLANSWAARSYYNMEGLVEFLELENLEKALQEIEHLQGNISIPIPPDPAPLLRQLNQWNVRKNRGEI